MTKIRSKYDGKR